MGSGISQVAAAAGWQVRLFDVTDDALQRGRRGIERSLERFVSKDQLSSDDAQATLARISTGTELADAADADVVVEAVFEKLEVKQELFERLDKICENARALATNTSAIPITHIAAATRTPERVVGTHFFSPVPLMQLCELVRGYRTSDETLAVAREFAESVGKTCIVVNRDVAGFVTTRLVVAFANEAAALVESGVVSPEDIDTACRLGFGHPMGPLATMDLTGLDVLYHAARNIYDETADPKFYPPETISRMVAAGHLGRKSGRGWFSYDG
jgi:3-hydroxybutyryl-CoA dehydrogenase